MASSKATDPHILHPNDAPTPFTADQIRHGCPKGRTVRLLVENEGAQPVVRVARFVECTDEGSIQQMWRESVDGKVIDPKETVRTTWIQLQGHASFPASTTTVEPETIETSLGPLDCLRYTVVRGEDVSTFWFAKDLPGMPVRFTLHRDGQRVSTSTVIANEIR